MAERAAKRSRARKSQVGIFSKAIVSKPCLSLVCQAVSSKHADALDI